MYKIIWFQNFIGFYMNVTAWQEWVNEDVTPKRENLLILDVTKVLVQMFSVCIDGAGNMKEFCL